MGFEFGVKLTAEKPGMVLYFDDFHQLFIRRLPGEQEPFVTEYLTVFIVELVAVPVAFVNFTFAIGSMGI